MSAATGTTPAEVEDLKKVAEQMSLTVMSVANHLLGAAPNSADAQKSVEKIKTAVSKGFTDVRINSINCITLFYLFKYISIFEFN